MQIGEFVSAVFDTWVEKVGVVLTVLSFVEKIPRVRKWLEDKPLLDRFVPLLWITGILCVLSGFYGAWRNERATVLLRDGVLADRNQAISGLQSELGHLRDDRTPHLVAVVDESVLGDSSNIHAAQVFLAITIKNIGVMPSIAQLSSASVWIGSKRIEVTPLGIPDRLSLLGPTGKTLLQFHKKEAIDEKTAVPIPSGGQAVGWLRLIISDYTKAQLYVPDARYEIHFVDVTGQDLRATSPIMGSAIAMKSPVNGFNVIGTEQPVKTGTWAEAERLSKQQENKSQPKEPH